jgi:class 3 adenylate cyclase
MSAFSSATRPRIRFSLRWKITLPFMFLALILGLGATYVINRLVSENEESRFLRQLANSGQLVSDAVVRSEANQLQLERMIANTVDVAEAVGRADSELLRERVMPLMVNSNTDTVAVLDAQGISLLTVRRSPNAPPGEYYTVRDEAFYAEWPFVGRLLQGETDEGVGDKRAGLGSVLLDEQVVEAFFVGGPLRGSGGQVIGAVLVGMYLEGLVPDLAVQAGANISIYDMSSGQLLASSLEPSDPTSLTLSPDQLSGSLGLSREESPVRRIVVAGSTFEEVLIPFVARGTDQLGVLGVSLLWAPVEVSAKDNLVMVTSMTALSLALIVLIGVLLSGSITRPLVEMAHASEQVATGNLQTRVSDQGSDEIGALARTFNYMVEGLREGSVYRDLLGLTLTPEVREQLRSKLTEGGSLLEGQGMVAAILFADLRGFAALAEKVEPAHVMGTLNEYFAGVVPIVRDQGGVINSFDGDAMMVSFGILPKRLPPQVSSLQAVQTGLAMLSFVEGLNNSRSLRGLPGLGMGIGVSTGPVIAGGIGSKDRLLYAVIGDTVNTAQRIQQATQESVKGGMLISEATYHYLGGARPHFEFGRKGVAQLRGKKELVTVIEVQGQSSRQPQRLEPEG